MLGGGESVTPNNPGGKVRATIQPNKTAASPSTTTPADKGGVNLKPSGGIAAPPMQYPEGMKK